MNRKQIFVFGANKAGRHGKGSALEAVKYHGATLGIGEGPQGASYGIPTKDENLEILSLEEIKGAVHRFLIYAAAHPDWDFNVVKIGCGLAAYQDSDIAPFFLKRTPNVRISSDWIAICNGHKPCTVVTVYSGLPYDHYMGRPGKGQPGPFGNPFVVGRDGERRECVQLFYEWLQDVNNPKSVAYLDLVKTTIKPGDVLACFCKSGDCHAWVIADYVNNGYCWKD